MEDTSLDFIWARAEALNQALADWRKESDRPSVAPGSVDELVRWFLVHPKVTRRAESTQRAYRQGLDLIRNHLLDSSRRLGTFATRAKNHEHADALYERLRQAEDGRERLAMANGAMRATRRTWNLALRARRVEYSPFAEMGLEQPESRAVPANRQQVEAFVRKADELGYPSMGTAMWITFELLQRETDVIGRLAWSHLEESRIKVVHHKTEKAVWVPLYDEAGADLFPDLVERLEQMPRRGTLIVMRDKPDRRGGEYLPYKPDHFRRLFRKIADAAGLPRAFTFLACATAA